MALPALLIATAIALAGTPSAAAGAGDGSFTGALEASGGPAASSSPPAPPARVDAPATLPLFAGALALLGWRMGRRRRR